MRAIMKARNGCCAKSPAKGGEPSPCKATWRRGPTHNASSRRRKIDKLRIFIDSANFAKKYGRISLTLQKSPDRRCDLSRRKHCCRHLIEQRLKEVMIRSINHLDIGVCTPKGFSGGEPRKTGTDNHDSLHSLPHSEIRSRILGEM